MVIAIAFSDIQIHDFKQYNSYPQGRLFVALNMMGDIARAAKKHQVPLLFAGDWFDNPDFIENTTLVETFRAYKHQIERNKLTLLAISGNHDQCRANTRENQSPNYLEAFEAAFESMKLLDFKSLAYQVKGRSGNIGVAGIPYLSGNEGFELSVKEARERLKDCDFKILLTHRDYYGALEPSGYQVNTTDNPKDYKKMFKGFDLVLSGHIHKPQKLFKKGYMLGATHHQRKSDMGCDMGYWIIYDDREPKFVKLKAPQFSMEDNGFDYFVPKPKETERVNTEDTSEFASQDRTQLAKSFCKIKKIKGLKKKKLIMYLTNG